MKKQIILLSCSFIFMLPLTAQEKKDGTYLGIKLNTNTGINHRYWGKLDWIDALQVQLEAGRKLKNNYTVGVRAGFGSTPQNTFVYQNGFTGYTNNPYWSADLFVRKDIKLDRRFSVYGEFALSHVWGKYMYSETGLNGSTYTANMKSRNTILGASAGLSFRITNWLSVDVAANNLLSIRYSSTKGTALVNNQPMRVSASRYALDPLNNLGQTISVGLKFRIGKK